jgi:hypothetical protein
MVGAPRAARRAETTISAERAAERLGVSKKRLRILAAQGRLEEEPGEGGEEGELRYDLKSVMRLEAENLIREMIEEAHKSCPQLASKIETLAVHQYMRGQMAGAESMADATLQELGWEPRRRAPEAR